MCWFGRRARSKALAEKNGRSLHITVSIRRGGGVGARQGGGAGAAVCIRYSDRPRLHEERTTIQPHETLTSSWGVERRYQTSTRWISPAHVPENPLKNCLAKYPQKQKEPGDTAGSVRTDLRFSVDRREIRRHGAIAPAILLSSSTSHTDVHIKGIHRQYMYLSL